MLIVSDFHDYYDVGMKMGVDKTVVYNRETKDIIGKFLPTELKPAWKPRVLGFCGKFYPFVYHTADHKVDRIIWNVEEAVKALPKSKYSYWAEDNVETEAGIRRFFDKKYSELDSLFHEHKSPILGLITTPARKYNWTKDRGPCSSLRVNPCLKEIEFYKVKDPITAFQDIHMFISGVLGVEKKPMIEVSDKVKAASHGHDGEYSFKKLPGKDKKRWR